MEQGVAEDAVGAEVADESHRVDHLQEGVVTHARLSDANPGNHGLRVRLQLLIEHDGRRDKDESRNGDGKENAEGVDHCVAHFRIRCVEEWRAEVVGGLVHEWMAVEAIPVRVLGQAATVTCIAM